MALQSHLALLEHMRHRAALKRLVQNHGDALANLWEGHRRGPFFSPARFPAPETTWPVSKAFDDAANPSNCAPHSPPNPLRSCFSGDILRCDVRLWPPGQTPKGASQAPHWTDNSQPSPLLAGRGSGSPPPSPHRPADADGFSTPHVF